MDAELSCNNSSHTKNKFPAMFFGFVGLLFLEASLKIPRGDLL